jgi:diguanylate cyclase (GGDEF)-like protein
MTHATSKIFDTAVWAPALEKFGEVSRLSVVLYDADGQLVCGPAPMTPLFGVLAPHGDDAGVFAECAHTCLTQLSDDRPPVSIAGPPGLAVVSTALRLDGRIVGALVAGYALVQACESVAIARLARKTGTLFPDLWAVARRQQPLSTRRVLLIGELLQVLGDALLQETDLRRRSEETATQMTRLANHDPLTDLPNRLLLADRLACAVALAGRHRRQLAVLFLDIDRFKSVNDTFGHLLGDELLQAIGETVSRCIRRSDTVGRQGGDEFVVVLSEVAHAEDAAKTAEKIIAALDGPHTVGGHEFRMTASIGISVFPDDGDEAETLLKHADMALYHAKDQGRDGYRFFEPALNVRAVARQTIETGLRRALDLGEFELWYQPKMNLQTRKVIGAEALIRWRHPERGLVAPAEFVPIAEDSGLIRPIGRWVVHEACRQAQAWRHAGLEAIPVAVNVSAVQFKDKQFLNHLGDVLMETGLEPGDLEIELTESVLMANVTATTEVLHALKTVGVQLAIDDFGTGYSSLSYLRNFPIDALKIDKSFVQEITADSSKAPIVSAVINMGKNLNLRVIAEGIETGAQLAFLQSEHCCEGQGYYFSRPVDARQFARLLEIGTIKA